MRFLGICCTKISYVASHQFLYLGANPSKPERAPIMGTISAMGPRPVNPIGHSRILRGTRSLVAAIVRRIHSTPHNQSLNDVSSDVLKDIGVNQGYVEPGLQYVAWRP
jgi:hypothetical protein